jgi:hypothetical protein
MGMRTVPQVIFVFGLLALAAAGVLVQNFYLRHKFREATTTAQVLEADNGALRRGLDEAQAVSHKLSVDVQEQQWKCDVYKDSWNDAKQVIERLSGELQAAKEDELMSRMNCQKSVKQKKRLYH